MNLSSTIDPSASATAPGTAGVGGGPQRPVRLAIVVSHPIQYFSHLFRRLAQQPGIDLTVLYSSLAGAMPAIDPGFGVTVAWDRPLLEGYKFKALKNLWRGARGRFWSCACPGMVVEMLRGGYDAVVLHGWSNLSACLALITARASGLPCMMMGDTSHIYEKDLSWLKRRVKKAVLGTLFRGIQAFCVMGPSNRMFYEGYSISDDKMFFTPQAVDNDYFRQRAGMARTRKDEIRARYGIPSHIVLLLFLAKLIPRKMPFDVVSVLRTLQPHFPDLGAVWVGDGELRRRLEAEIAEHGIKHAFLLGFRNQTELPDIFAMSDILILPSWHDPMPLVTNEAMASGLPVIASDRTGVCGPQALVRDGETGFVYPAGNTKALSEAVRKLLEDARLRQAMGRRASQVVEEFGPDRYVEGILGAVRFVVRC